MSLFNLESSLSLRPGGEIRVLDVKLRQNTRIALWRSYLLEFTHCSCARTGIKTAVTYLAYGSVSSYLVPGGCPWLDFTAFIKRCITIPSVFKFFFSLFSPFLFTAESPYRKWEITADLCTSKDLLIGLKMIHRPCLPKHYRDPLQFFFILSPFIMEGSGCEKLDIWGMPGNKTTKLAKFTSTGFIICFCPSLPVH